MDRRWRGALRAALLIVGLWMCTVASADDRILLLDPAVGRVTLANEGLAWTDPTGRASIDEVAAGQDIGWTPTTASQIHPLHAGTAVWLRFTVGETDDSQRWWLDVPYSALDRITLYTSDGQGHWTGRAAGDSLPVASWPVPHRHPVLPLALTPASSQQFFVKLENARAFGAPLVFISERELLRQEQLTSLMLGLYFGLAGLSVALALAAGVALRDPAFNWYALTVTLIGLSQAALTGIAGLHLWPTLAWWNDVSVAAIPIAALAVLLMFLSALVSLQQRLLRLHRLVTALSVVCLGVAAMILAVDPTWRVRLMVPAAVAAVSVSVGVLAWAARRGDRHAGWLLVGMVPVGLGSALPLARAAGLLPVGFWTTNGLLLGTSVEMPILLAVMAARVQDRLANTRRILGFDRVDPATGLLNAHVFQVRLSRLIARTARLKHEALVLLVDIVNVEQIRRDFDRRSADELPLRVASRLLAFAREIDTVARLSEHRFGILVEGPLSREEAMATGAKVVARCLMPFDGKPLEWVPHVRVAQAVIPGTGDAQLVVDKLGAVLAMAPADSKRAVYTIGM